MNSSNLEQKLTLLWEHSPFAAIEWNTQLEIVDWNPGAMSMFGYAKSEIIGVHAIAFIGTDQATTVTEKMFQPILQQNCDTYSTCENLTQSGNSILCQWHNMPLTDEEGNVAGVLSIVENVTPHKTAETTLLESPSLKIAEAELKKTQNFLQSILHNLPVPVIAKDAQDLRFVLWNPAAEATLGLQAEEVLGKNDYDFFPPEQAQGFVEKDREVLQSDTVIDIPEELVQTGSGETRVFHTKKTAVLDTEGHPQYLLAIIEDITERKATEASLRESEAKFRQFVEDANDLIYAHTLEGILTYLSPKFEELTGYASEEFIGKPFAPLIHPDDLPDVYQFINQVVTGHKFAGHEFRLQHRDGNWLWMVVNSSAIKQADGTIIGIQGIVRDITERKQAEQQLQEQAERERLLNVLTNQILSSLNFEEILSTTVEQVRKFLGIDRCNFAWTHLEQPEPGWEIVKESCLPELPSSMGIYPSANMGAIAKALLNQEIFRIDDVRQLSDRMSKRILRHLKTQSILILPMSLSPKVIGVLACAQSREVRHWRDEEVEFLEAVMVQLSIALNQAELYQQTQARAQELEEALLELQRTQTQLVQSEKMSSLGQLVAGVAHEINNPVNFIYGNLTHADEYATNLIDLLNLYQRYYPSPVMEIEEMAEEFDLEFVLNDLPQLLSSMKVGAERIKQIVQSLRNFSRMDESAMKAVNIHEGIESTLMILQNRLKAKPDQAAIEVIKEYGELPLVECYAGELNQVFMNILSNAIDALEERDRERSPLSCKEEPSQIRIMTTVLDSQEVQIAIADNGPGIPDDFKQRIFDPFVTTKPIGKGTGLGMSISYQIITERHNGTLQCESQLGQGAKFLITIPLDRGL